MREITEPANKIADTIIEGMRNGAAKGGNKNFNPDYTLTRPKRLRKFEKVDGVKVVKSDWAQVRSPYSNDAIINRKTRAVGAGHNTNVIQRDY